MDGHSEMTSRLHDMAGKITDVKETHHFYSLLVYFRAEESFCAVARLCLVTLDAVALIKSELDAGRYAKMTKSSAIDGFGSQRFACWTASTPCSSVATDDQRCRGH
jgi:hypothetical protein